jgi:hypothetical protein
MDDTTQSKNRRDLVVALMVIMFFALLVCFFTLLGASADPLFFPH